MTGDNRLDRLLERHFHEEADRDRDREAAARVLAALAQPLPPQRRWFRTWPSALLRWDLAPAWPRVAALAGCGMLGFAVGFAALNLLPGEAPQQAMRGDFRLAAVLSEPEPLTGVVP
jgi:hypothetical protein